MLCAPIGLCLGACATSVVGITFGLRARPAPLCHPIPPKKERLSRLRSLALCRAALAKSVTYDIQASAQDQEKSGQVEPIFDVTQESA